MSSYRTPKRRRAAALQERDNMENRNGTPALQMRGITKTYPGVRALDCVDFDVRKGEVHALSLIHI